MKYRSIVAALLLLVSFASFVSAQGNTLEIGTTSEGAPTLVAANGMTLYTFSHDEGGVSACYDECAVAWPPYTIDPSVAPTVGAGIPGTVATVQRDDGTLQVTYEGEPLYFFQDDAAPGDANGEGLQDVWFAANPALVMLGGSDELGEFLVGPGGITLYVFLEDMEGESRCYHECTREWPPLLASIDLPPLAGDGVTGTLGSIQRDDGSWQVTYNGAPLYFFHEDEEIGDTNGQGSQEVWFVVPPEGQSSESGG
jgi:predicted lipoprotein with Yx(FWY)xxD motif